MYRVLLTAVVLLAAPLTFCLAAEGQKEDEEKLSREDMVLMIQDSVRIRPTKMGFFTKGMELVRIGLTNPLEEPVTCAVTWLIPSTQWRVHPKSKKVKLGPGDSTLLTFEVHNQEKRDRDYPTPEVKIEFLGVKILADPVPVSHKLKLHKCYRTVYFKKSPIIDGDISEWKSITSIELGKKKDFASFKDVANWSGPKDLSAEVMVARDANHMFIAVRVHDDVFFQEKSNAMVYEGDSVQIAIDVLKDDDPFFREKNLVNYEYAFALTPKGALTWRHIAPQLESRGRDDNVTMKIKRSDEKKETVYEVAIPLLDMQAFYKSQQVVGFSVIINDNDGKGRKGWLQWTPGMGEAKDAVYYGEVIFEE